MYPFLSFPLPFFSSFYVWLTSSLSELQNPTQLSLHCRDLSPRSFPVSPCSTADVISSSFWDAAVLVGSHMPAVGKKHPQSTNARQQTTVIIPTISMPSRWSVPNQQHSPCLAPDRASLSEVHQEYCGYTHSSNCGLATTAYNHQTCCWVKRFSMSLKSSKL